MNKTQIFKDYSEFLEREDKTLNGVSEDFAKQHPGYVVENAQNEACWNCCNSPATIVGNSGCRYCSDCRDCSDCIGCIDCRDCIGCIGCRVCSGCIGCIGCRVCSGCSGCRDLENNKVKGQDIPKLVIPKIENIHQKILEAASQEDALNMESWHTCSTTHCRAGWAVHLAGEDGYKLEKFYGGDTLVAAMRIYNESSTIHVACPRFFDTNEKATNDMKRCAEEEKKLSKV